MNLDATRPASPRNRDEFIALLDYALLIGKTLNRQLDEALALRRETPGHE